jgi:hypothetical protein
MQKIYEKNHAEILRWLKQRRLPPEEARNCYVESVMACMLLEPSLGEQGLTVSLLRNGAMVQTKVFHRSQLIESRTKRKLRPLPPPAPTPDTTKDTTHDNGWIDSH